MHSGAVTGRIASVTLPTGGKISYTYTGGHNGINCSDGSAAGLTRQDPDGTWTYTEATGSPASTTVTDPQGNQTVYYLQGVYQAQRKVYQGSSTSGTLLQTVDTCYNVSASPCTGTSVNLPITQRTVTLTWPGGLQAHTTSSYNTYGLPTEVDEYGYNGSLLRKTLTSYPTPKLTVAWETIFAIAPYKSRFITAPR